MRDQLDLYGNVASDATAFRVIDSIDVACLDRLRGAVAVARARAWKLGARPQRAGKSDSDARPELTVIDVDATLTTAHSAKEQAAGNFKHGFGHHPLLCYLDDTGEALAGILRPGNAGSNTAADHKQVIDLALAQLDPQALAGEILVRGDGAGATHELTDYCREGQMRFSFGFDLTEPVREAIIAMPESAWVNAIRADGSEREHSQVCEITGRVDLSAWPAGSRLIARRTKLRGLRIARHIRANDWAKPPRAGVWRAETRRAEVAGRRFPLHSIAVLAEPSVTPLEASPSGRNPIVRRDADRARSGRALRRQRNSPARRSGRIEAIARPGARGRSTLGVGEVRGRRLWPENAVERLRLGASCWPDAAPDRTKRGRATIAQMTLACWSAERGPGHAAIRV